MKNKIKVIAIIISMLLISFTAYQSIVVQEKEHFIIGTWVIDGEDTNKYIFTSNNECKWEFEGSVTDEFNYSIESEFTESGLEIPIVILTNINNPNEIFEYEIIGLSETNMILATYKPKINYTYFIKQ
ncbi:hypothetical protein N9Q68_01900 [Polaribacter sp.]|nr:hypothetical protein [Polaribacter sp.]